MTENLPTVLVVADDEMMRQFLVAAVSQLGYAAVGCPNVDSGIEAVEKIPSLRLLLSDLNLGAETGPDLVRRALRNRPDLKVVFMTGGFDNVAFRRTDPVLNKPFDLQRLRDAIEDAFRSDTAALDESRLVGDRRR